MTVRKARVLHVVAGLHPDHGGPSRTVVALTDAISTDPAWEVTLLSQALSGSRIVLQRQPAVYRVVARSRSETLCALGVPLLRQLRRELGEEPSRSLLHIHGVWSPAVHWACSAARGHQIPYLVQPRGMLKPWALSYRAWKKRAAMRLYQRRDLSSAAVLVATATKEAESLRELGFKQPIAIIPNGVEVAGTYGTERQTREFRKNNKGWRSALFMSRIHPIKNLETLIRAWGKLSPDGWRLCIAGPDEGGHRKEMENLVRESKLSTQIEFLGPLDDVKKARAYAQADLFILPSFSENFGVVVAEAMSHGLPVITTHGTPWSQVEALGCGWWVSPDIEGLAGALGDAISRDRASLIEMGSRAREYALEFSWEKIGLQTAAVYRWILDQGARPDYVVL